MDISKIVGYAAGGVAAMVGIGALLVGLFILAPLFGGIAAMIIGWIFPYTTDTVREVTGLNLTDFQIGATLAFVGGFFK